MAPSASMKVTKCLVGVKWSPHVWNNSARWTTWIFIFILFFIFYCFMYDYYLVERWHHSYVVCPSFVIQRQRKRKTEGSFLLCIGSSYTKPLDIGINIVTRKWVGFIKIHLQHPKWDGLDDGRWGLSHQQGREGIQAITKAKHMWLHLKGKVLHKNMVIAIHKNLMQECSYGGREAKILSLMKLDNAKDFTFITFITEESREDLLVNGLTHHQRSPIGASN